MEESGEAVAPGSPSTDWLALTSTAELQLKALNSIKIQTVLQ